MGLLEGGLSEAAWRWRCKLGNANHERTLADYKSDASSSASDLKDNNGTPTVTLKQGFKKGKNVANDQGPGSTASVKTFYEGPGSDEFNKMWVDYPPRQPSKRVALAQGRVAIKLYKIKDKSKPIVNGKFALKYHMIELQNPALVGALEPILKKEHVHLDPNEMATFAAPFRPLYFCYDEIVAKCSTLSETDTLKPFMQLFIKVMDEVFADLRQKKKSLEANGLVSFPTAWAYFARDAPVITQGPNCEYLCKVVDTSIQTTPTGELLLITVKSLKFTGEAFIWTEHVLKLTKFAGNKPINELAHFPLQYHADPESLKQRMDARGRLVLDYQGLTYCSYDGLAIFSEDKKIERHNVEGRILIDVVGYNKHHLAKGVREDNEPETAKNTVEGTGRQNVRSMLRAQRQMPKPEPQVFDENENSEDENKVKEGDLKRLTQKEQDKNREAILAQPDTLMYMSPLLQGFALKNKQWLQFYVEDLKPIIWNDKAYDHLVYDEQQKDLVLSFVESHKQAREQDSDDVIVGKGQGLIILLSGPPGTGKTLTAEAVADRTHRPLFYLEANDLGVDAGQLAANIKKVFAMATEWNAVVLLDEADVFMSERHPQDIARNELVSIFLRELEYFRGIIFLTTNLYQTIDSAFRSRVSLHLLFKPLTVQARVQVWHKFLNRIPGASSQQQGKGKKKITSGATADEDEETLGDDHNNNDDAVDEQQKKGKEPAKRGKLLLDEEDIQELAQWQLNGREIKNAVKMVKTWCEHKGYEITLSRVENSIKVTSPHAARLNKAGEDDDLYN